MVKTIQVSDETYRELEKGGAKGDTFDDIVYKLLKTVRHRTVKKKLSMTTTQGQSHKA